jgi:hypothetical protein
MKTLSYAKLPDSFCMLLRAEGHGKNSMDDVFDRCYQTDIPFRALFNRLFPEILKMKVKPERLGRAAIKEKLAASYMEKYRSIDSLDQIKRLEQTFSDFTVDGHSRSFLLGFYLKMSILSNNPGHDQVSHEILTELTTLLPPYLKLTRAKVWRIDFIALSLWHYHNFLGSDQLSELLKRGISHADIFRKLKIEERELLAANLLTYGMSIGETESFYSPMLE